MATKTEEQLRQQYQRLQPALDERGRREWAGSEAMTLGRGGIMRVHRASGLARNTIRRGIEELRARERGQRDDRDPADAGEPRRLRRPGGGRKKKTDQMPKLAGALEALIEPTTRGDPQSPLRWTLKSARVLAEQLVTQGFEVSERTVHRLLKTLGYSLQSNKKTIEGTQDPDRDAQFRYIAEQTSKHLESGQVPVLSVDTKKKELVGAYKNGGREYRKVGVRSGSRHTTSSARPVESAHTGCTTWATTAPGSASVSVPTRASSQSTACAGGGRSWVPSATRMPNRS